MPLTAAHPNSEQLTSFALGKLGEAETAAVADHLGECASCRQAVDAVPDDHFLTVLHSLPPSDSISFADSFVPAELINHPRYRLLEWLGHGGQGVAYRAQHRLTDRRVVIKTISKRLTAKPEAVERFKQEIQVTGKLDHPNIVTCLDAEQVGDLHYLVLENIDGKNLSKLVEEKGPLPVAEACAYTRQAALGLQHAHEQGVIHRDISPKNLMVDTQGKVKILDFGLAGLTGEEEAEFGIILGNPDTIAPEQIRNAADGSSDIYSLGCTLYFLLTGQFPFSGKNLHEKLIAHLEQEPTPIGQLRKDVPKGLALLVEKMLAARRARRFQSAKELAGALENYTGKKRKGLLWTAAGGGVLLLASLLLNLVLLLPKHTPRVENDQVELVEEDATIQELPPKRIGERLKNSVGMEFALIPSGKFIMGSFGDPPEGPQHEVIITKPFYMGAHQVTQGQFEKVMGGNPSQSKLSGRHPVENLTWKMAGDFCGKLSSLKEEQEAKRKYRLPTEAEWEYACRAGSTADYCFGNNDPQKSKLTEYAYVRPLGEILVFVISNDPVGTFKPNAWGLYDMHGDTPGNSDEWCQDYYDEDYYLRSLKVNPKGPPQGDKRVVRGGRSAQRRGEMPTARSIWLGFRVVCEVEP